MAVAAALAAWAPSANAGIYTVEACTPANTPGESVVQPVVTSSFNSGFFRCGNMFDGGIRVATAGRSINGGPIRGGAGWRVVAPPDTMIEEVEMERLIQFEGANGMRWGVFKSGNRTIELAFADGTTPPSSGGVVYQVHAPEVAARFECPTSLGCEGEKGTFTGVTSKNFFIRLQDALPPSATLPASAGSLHGTVSLPYEGVDRGSGVLLARLILDPVPGVGGTPVAEDHDENGGKCQPQFKELVPCRLQLASSFRLDTTQIPNGPHTLAVQILDAAANLRLGDPVPIVVENGGGTLGPPPGPMIARDTAAPVLSGLSLSRKRFRTGATMLRFASSEAATLSVAVARAPKVKTSKRPKPLVTLTRTIGAGSGQLKLNARRGRKPLRPGRYTVSVSARDAAGNLSKESRLSFTILPG